MKSNLVVSINYAFSGGVYLQGSKVPVTISEYYQRRFDIEEGNRKLPPSPHPRTKKITNALARRTFTRSCNPRGESARVVVVELLLRGTENLSEERVEQDCMFLWASVTWSSVAQGTKSTVGAEAE